jgi:UDP-N-acetylglucosamine:LPS N-acetylglucosamine transferase
VDPHRVRETFGISQGRPIIFLLMGASGARRAVRFAQAIEKIDLPVELVIGIGQNAKLHDDLLKLPCSSRVSRHIIGYTPRIADLMGVADLLVTKAGPSTIFEAIHRDLPMVIDNATRIIRWEEMNVSFVKEHGLGAVMRRTEDLPHLIYRHLLDDAYRVGIQRNFASFDKRRFREEFQRLVTGIIGS